MDEKTQELLNAWGFSTFVNVFKDHHIDFDQLKELTESDLLLLFSNKVGLKGKFQKALQRFLNSELFTVADNIDSCAVQLPDENLKIEELDFSKNDFGCGVCESESHKELPQDPQFQQEEYRSVVVNQKNGDLVSLEDGASGFIQYSNTSSSTPPSAWESSSILQLQGEGGSLPNSTSYTEGTSPELTLSTSELIGMSLAVPSHENASRSTLTIKRGRSIIEDNEPFQKRIAIKKQNIVRKYLKQNCVGSGLLQLTSAKLDSASRGKLCHEIVVREVGADGQKLITASRFIELAEAIVKVFPKETVTTFFIPRKPAHGSQPPIQPKGLLYDKYHNLLKFLRKTGLRQSTRNGLVSKEETNVHAEPTVVQDIEWLQKHSTESEATKKWRNTVKFRIAALRNSIDVIAKSKTGVDKVLAYFDRYTFLSQAWGLKLLLNDFEYLYGGKYLPLKENWPQTYKKLLILANKTELDVAPYEIVQCLKLIPAFFKQPILFYGSKQRRKSWKPNASESSQGFFLHVQALSHLEPEIQKIENRCKLVNKMLQPLPAFVGNCNNEIADSYVLIGDKRLRVESPLAAMDICFKLFHALHCHYPCQASYSWLFLQKAVYRLCTEWDLDAPAVNTMSKSFKDIEV